MFRTYAKALCTLVLLSGITFAQDSPQASSVLLSLEEYNHLLDTLVLREHLLSKDDFVMVLRFLPNEDLESQLVIEAEKDGLLKVTRYTLTDEAYQAIKQARKEDIQAVGKSLKVQTTRMQLPGWTAESLRQSLFTAMREEQLEIEKEAVEFRKTGEVSIVLHGAQYDLWYVQNRNEIHWSVSDFDTDAKNWDLPLGRWMNRIRLTAK